MTGPGQVVLPVAALVCGGLALFVGAGRNEGVRRARLLLAGPGTGGGGTAVFGTLPGELVRRVRKRVGPEWWCPVAGLVVGLTGESWLPVVAGAAAVAPVARLLRRRAGRQKAERREQAVVELCSAVAGELRAGRQPEGALAAVGDEVWKGLGSGGAALPAAARYGGDVPGALRELARLPGASGLLGVAACWQVAVEGGAGLADGLDRIAAALRAERDQREDLRAQLDGPRATAVVLAFLPVFGLALGSAMGAGPLRVLLHTPAGLGCLLVGGLLQTAGLWWVFRLVRGAEDGESTARPSQGAAK